MLELLIAGLCIGNFRCDQASEAYFVYNPVPKIWAEKKVRQAEKAAIQLIGQQAVIGIATVAAFATQKTYQIRITNRWSIGKFESTMPLNTYSVPGVMYGFNF